METDIDKNAHNWGEPTYVWAEDHSKVTATRICTRDAGHKETEDAELADKVVKDPTCTEKGSTTYTSKAFTNTAFTAQTVKVETNIVNDAHDWGEPTYVWADDYSKVTATRVCKWNPEHKETEDAALDKTAVVDPTCTAKGSITYTSKAFTNTAFAAQTKTVETDIDKDAHDWGEPTYVWANDHSKVTATRICKINPEHKETEDTALDKTAVVDPTCTAKGSITYTSKAFANQAFVVQTETVETDIDKDAHDWGEPTYVWADDHSKVTATRVCKINPEHKETEEAALDKTAVVDPTCTAKGSITYTSKAFTNTAFAVQTETVETDIDKDAHTWGNWSVLEDGTHKRVCKNCSVSETGKHEWDNWTSVTADYHQHNCKICGEAFETGAHNYENGVCTVCGRKCEHTGGTATCTKKAVCTICGLEYGDVDAGHHTLVSTAAKAATCTAAGNSAYWTCSECRKYFSDAEGKKEIQKDSWIIAKNPTAHPEGKLTETAAKAATCTAAGNSAYWTCSECGKYFSDAEGKTEIQKDSWLIAKDPAAHPEGKLTGTASKAATCTAAGNSAYWTCSECGKYFSDAEGKTEIQKDSWIIAKDPEAHPEGKLTETAAKAATCTAAGNSAYWTCSECGKYFSDAEGKTEIQKDSWIISATGHSWKASKWNWAEDYSSATADLVCEKDDTHTKEGVTATVSSEETKAATCEGNKAVTYTAAVTVDGKSFTDRKENIEIEGTAKEHQWGEWKTTKAATVDQQGLKERVCKVCQEKQTQTIPKITPSGGTRPVAGVAEEQHTVGDFTLTITDPETRTVTITSWKGTGEEEELTLPDTVEIDGHTFTVTGIGAGAFTGNSKLKKIILGDKVEVIGKDAFRDCKGLTVLDASKCENLQMIEESAFDGCETLETVLINITSLELLEANVFAGIAKNAVFDVFYLDAQKLMEARAMLQTKKTGWLPDMTLEQFQYSVMNVAAEGYKGEYDGQPHGITVNVTDPATGSTVKYGTAEGTYDSDSLTYTNAGVYTVYYQVTADQYKTVTGSATVEITARVPADLTIQLSSNTYYYYAKARKPAVTVKDGDTVVPESEYRVTYKNNIHAGTATVKITSLSRGNYSFREERNFTIKPRNVHLKWSKLSFTYDGKYHQPEGKIIGLYAADADKCHVIVDGSGRNVGRYIARAIGLDNDDYKLVETPEETRVIFYINPRH